MYAITLQIGKRKTDTYAEYFSSEEVANYVAGTLQGYDDGEAGPVTGVVIPVTVNMSASIEDYKDSQVQVEELAEREAWDSFYDAFSDEEKALMGKFGPASLTDGA